MQSRGVDQRSVDDGDRWGWRAPVVGLFVIMAVLAAGVAVSIGWTRATLIDTNGYVNALVVPLASDPEVKDAVAAEMAREMTANMEANISAQLEAWVPASNTLIRQAISQFSRQIEQGWRDGLQPALRAQLDLPSFNALWVEANHEAHAQLIDALKDGTTGKTVTLDLHAIAQAAVRETGVQIDSQLGLPGEIGTKVYKAIAEHLPAEAGRISVDVSRIPRSARTGIVLIDPLFVVSLAIAAFCALVAIGVAPRRRRGVAVMVLGAATLALSVGLWLPVKAQAEGVGDRVSELAVKPLSAEMRFVLDRQAELAVDSFRAWALGTAAVGAALLVVGALWLVIARRSRPDTEPASPYPPVERWSDPPATTWSSNRPY
jgi:hypothetical protein